MSHLTVSATVTYSDESVGQVENMTFSTDNTRDDIIAALAIPAYGRTPVKI